MTHAFSSGVKEVFRVRLASGRELHATANHPFLTYGGWQRLRNSRSARGWQFPGRRQGRWTRRRCREHEIIMLAHLLGDGSFVKRQPIRYASVDEENLRAVADGC